MCLGMCMSSYVRIDLCLQPSVHARNIMECLCSVQIRTASIRSAKPYIGVGGAHQSCFPSGCAYAHDERKVKLLWSGHWLFEDTFFWLNGYEGVNETVYIRCTGDGIPCTPPILTVSAVSPLSSTAEAAAVAADTSPIFSSSQRARVFRMVF